MGDRGTSGATSAARPRWHARIPHGPVWVVVAALTALTAVVFLALIPHLGARSQPPPLDVPWWALTLGFVVAERSRVWVRIGSRQGIGLTLSDIPLTVGLFFCGPLAVLLARLIGTASNVVARGHVNARKDAFNLATHGLAAGLAIVTWRLIMGDADLLGPRAWLATVVAVLLAEVVTTLCIDLVIWADTGARESSQLQMGLENLVAAASACFGLVFVYVMSVDWRAGWLVLVVTLVLFVAHRSYAALQRRSQDVESVSAFTGRLGQFLDVDSVIGETLRTMSNDLNAEIAELYVEDPAAPLAAVWRLSGERDAEVQVVPLRESAIGLIDPPDDEPLVLPRTLRTVRAALPRRAGVRDALTVPVLREGVPVGTALVANRGDTVRSFGPDDIAQLRAIANHAATGLHTARLTEDLRTSLIQREHQATHDELTGLPNRRAFVERLSARVAAGQASVVAVIDLDRFHEVNDLLGAATGDLLLNLMAARFADTFGSDRVARLGADEFAVMFEGTTQEALVELSAIRKQVQNSITLDDIDLSPDVSVGIAAHHPGTAPSAALAHADLALRRAKTEHAGVAVYDPRLDRATADRLTLLVDLREAVASGALSVHFQPQVSVTGGGVVGFEALARWAHPQRGFVPPDEFIPIAEQGGLMMEITLFVLDTSLAQLAEWRRSAPERQRDLGVSVNVSPRTLIDPDLLVQTERMLALHGIPADRLTIEITETDIMAEPERAVTALQAFSDLGVRLSVDDLGTGYSSLAYLSRFPLDELKIDKTFIFQLVEDPATEAIVDAVIGLGRRLGRTVVAEGVEDAATWSRLRVLGCDTAQGYLLSRPLPPEDVLPWLSAWGGVTHLPVVSPAASRVRAR